MTEEPQHDCATQVRESPGAHSGRAPLFSRRERGAKRRCKKLLAATDSGWITDLRTNLRAVPRCAHGRSRGRFRPAQVSAGQTRTLHYLGSQRQEQYAAVGRPAYAGRHRQSMGLRGGRRTVVDRFPSRRAECITYLLKVNKALKTF